jgi:hypothetical protein
MRHSRKSLKNRTKRRGSRRLRGGAYGVGAAIAPGALESNAAYTGPVNSSGTPVPDPTDPKGGFSGVGGRRRRRSTRRRKMRGGSGRVSMGTVGYSYGGDGTAGLASHSQYTTQGNAY